MFCVYCSSSPPLLESMELESEEGAKIPIKRGSTTHIGRALGFPSGPSSSDRSTVSRRHVSLHHDEFGLQFEVIGRNPIAVRSANGGGDRVYRNSEKGELKPGDRVSLSLKTPYFWVVRRVGGGGGEGEVDSAVLDAVERREKRTLERRRRRRREEEEAARAPIYVGEEVDDEVFNAGLESDLAHLDLSQIDPVQEFGFIVMGHEFDTYPKQKLRPMKSWNWYLEEPRENSGEEEGEAADDEAVTSKRESKNRRRERSGGECEDEDWRGESEDEKEFISKSGSAKRSKYSTRSKDPKKPRNDSMQRKGVMGYKDEEYGEDEEDETLGGFIVDDEDEEEATTDEEEEEEEEEFDEEYDGDDDNH